MNTHTQRAIVLSLLVLLMAATRTHVFSHFAPVPDASWAVFFIGGFYLRAWTRWAFPLLMALAVLIDWWVISSQGISFWSHYCVSPGYWFLIPAHLAMWLGGLWLARHYKGASVAALGRLAASLFAATALCHLLAQGSFYWLSSSVAEPTFAGWWKNYSDWFLPYLRSTAMFVAVAAIAQVASEQIVKHSHAGAQERKQR
ncbi:hypothetical protein M2650_07390 [Luteimonas sp. SX5]|uniref:Uncharacterized protein n=1 Tax=Luteimonas galliterrae TaxID=2940486 RepID=A0ABT0MHU9_9GAMM|nr:hypothetical protein [Luteimonas galliterrae]MCL1634454.1 hypothetical protein [Luteimonas galliterrae]